MSRKAVVASLLALAGVALAASAAYSLILRAQGQGQRSVSTDGGPVRYEFGRPVRPDEQTYDW